MSNRKTFINQFWAILFIFSAALCCGGLYAQDSKVPVHINHTGRDSVGLQLAYSIREQIRGSNGFRLTQNDEAGLYINIITINPDRDDQSSSNWAVAAVTFTMRNFLPFEKGNPQTWYELYLSSTLATIGRNRTESQAKAILADLDAALEKYRQDARK
jgi:hypothetical protein